MSSNKKTIKNLKIANDEYTMVVSFKWYFAFVSVKKKKYISYHKNEEEFIKKFKIIFRKLIPEISKFKYCELIKQDHCHKIKYEDTEKIKDIVKESTNNVEKISDFDKWWDNNFGDEEFYQLGFQGTDGIRLFGTLRFGHIFEVLFIDFHHSFYPDKNFNQDDHDKYKYCPIIGGK